MDKLKDTVMCSYTMGDVVFEPYPSCVSLSIFSAKYTNFFCKVLRTVKPPRCLT